jgi:hypothetical protein
MIESTQQAVAQFSTIILYGAPGAVIFWSAVRTAKIRRARHRAKVARRHFRTIEAAERCGRVQAVNEFCRVPEPAPEPDPAPGAELGGAAQPAVTQPALPAPVASVADLSSRIREVPSRPCECEACQKRRAGEPGPYYLWIGPGGRA